MILNNKIFIFFIKQTIILITYFFCYDKSCNFSRIKKIELLI